jgi:UDP-N-acetylglucosamine acyltransferase
MAKIHSTAIVHPAAELASDVEVGPFCVIESDVRIGSGCRLAEHVIVRRFTEMGRDNLVDAFCVLGGLPQDFKFAPDCVTYLRIGDGNVFREGVTISRATRQGNATVVGNNTYWMAGAHAGHDSLVEDQVVLVNGSVVAGHAVIGPRAILSSHAGVHQFCWVGELALLQGNAGVSMHVPPYTIAAKGINLIGGLNIVGLRRAKDLSDKDRQEIREAFDLTYRRGLSRQEALAEMDSHGEWGAAAGKFRDFLRKVTTAQKPYNRGLCKLLMKD